MGIIDETHQAEGLQIYIGSENNLFGLTDCTTIISPFRNKDKEIIGAIGVIGPMRLNYAKIIPVVDYTANMICKKFYGHQLRFHKTEKIFQLIKEVKNEILPDLDDDADLDELL